MIAGVNHLLDLVVFKVILEVVLFGWNKWKGSPGNLGIEQLFLLSERVGLGSLVQLHIIILEMKDVAQVRGSMLLLSHYVNKFPYFTLSLDGMHA